MANKGDGRPSLIMRQRGESFYQKFPDSERGEMKERASFLGDFDDTAEDRAIGSFKTLQEMSASPTKGDKIPFSKTPRAKMGADPEEAKDDAKESANPRGLRGDDQKQKSPKKSHILGKLFLSKHRNKK